MTPQQPLKLHRFRLSGHSHRAQLFLSLLGLPVELVDVDLSAGAHKKPEFLALNSLGQVPVLEDAGRVIADSNAILVYLAERYDTDRRYYPADPEGKAQVQRWLSVAAGPLFAGPCVARLVRVFGAETSRAVGDNQVLGAVAFEPGKRGLDIELRSGHALGWTEKSYPFPPDTTTAGGLEPLLLPWGDAGKRSYHWNGNAYVMQ